MYSCVRTYYWFELVPFAAMFAINSATPPSSRKFCTTPVLLTKTTAKERQEVDFHPVINPQVRMPGNFDADVYFRLIANHCRVDNEDE